MYYYTIISVMSLAFTASAAAYRALIHNGTADCDGCPQSVGALLSSSPYHFDIHYAGVDQEYQVNAETLSKFDVYAHGGGPDVDEAWDEAETYKQDVQKFVSNGGVYLGFCLGAFLAGTNFFDLIPGNADVASEIKSKNPQVDNPKDTVIQVDWRFSNGSSIQDRWAYFQEGAVMTGISGDNVIGRYSTNQDVCSSVTPYGNGWVGLVGIHPEADQSWYDNVNITNPDGVKFDIGYDFIAQVMSRVNGSESSSSLRMGIAYVLDNLGISKS